MARQKNISNSKPVEKVDGIYSSLMELDRDIKVEKEKNSAIKQSPIRQSLMAAEKSNFQDGGMKTVKSEDGTITNVIQNPDGSKTVQVKTKDGKYFEKIIPMDYWGELDQAKEKHNEQQSYENALNYAGIAAYPAAIVSSVVDARDGNYGDAAIGLVPYLSKEARASQLVRRNAITKLVNMGVPYNKAKYVRPAIDYTTKALGFGATGHDLGLYQDGGVKDNIIYPPGDSEYMDQPSYNYDIIEMLNQKARRGYEEYLHNQTDPTNINRASPAYQQKFQMREGLVSAQDGGYIDTYQEGGTKTFKSKDGTVTNKFINANGDTVIQVKDKNGKFSEKIIPNIKADLKIPKNMAEAQQMMDSGELDYESYSETKARNKKEAEERKQERDKSLSDYEKRVSNPKYNSFTGLPGEDWRENLANEGAPLGAKFRVSQEDNFFDDYLNPLAMIGSGAQSLGEAPKLAKETNSYMPYVTAIGTPLLTGALASVGANNTKQFVNNLVNPLAGTKNIFSKTSKPAKSVLSDYRNIEELRRGYHDLGYEEGSHVFSSKEHYDKVAKEAKDLYKKYSKEFEKKYGPGRKEEILIYGAHKELKNHPERNFLINEDFSNSIGVNSNLTNQEKFLSDTYQLEFSELFNKTSGADFNPRFAEEMSQEMDNVIGKNKINKPIQVKRTSNFNRDVRTKRDGSDDFSMVHYNNLKEGDIIYPDHLWSTTSDVGNPVWGSDTNPVARINLPSEQKVLRPNSYINSQYPNEQEIILPKEAGYKVSTVNQGSKGDDIPRFIFDAGYRKGGYVDTYQEGGAKTPAQAWQNITGTPWSEAKKRGLTTGSAQDNLALLERLNKGEFSSNDSGTNLNTFEKVETPAEKGNLDLSKAKNFNEAFNLARGKYGANHIFEFKGRKYGTNLEGEEFKPSEEVLTASGMNEEPVKKRIESQNKKLNNPYINKRTVKLQPDEYKNWEDIKEKKSEFNKASNADLIVNYKKENNDGKNYVIVDKKKGLMHVYKPTGDLIHSSAIDLGANPGDAQTVTKVQDINGDGKIDSKEAQIAKADFSQGNKSTGAGKFYISNIDNKGYGGMPLLNMMNEAQYDNYLKTGKKDNVATSFHKGFIKDDKTRVSNGCIRCNKSTLDNLVNNLENTSEVYILPEDEGNSFVYENGKLNFKVKANKDYNSYVDSKGKTQKGQGVNRSVNSINYIPIKANLKKGFLEGELDVNQRNVASKYAKSLEANKQKIIKAAKINGDVYNDIAKISFGILGVESNFGEEHTPAGNFLRAVNKSISPSSSSSPDYKSKYNTYGINEKSRSAGLTQIRWSYLNKDEKETLNKLGISSNKDFLNPEKAAIGTAAILAVRYNQQLNEKQKKDIYNNLPKKWNTRGNYSARVKAHANYLELQEKNVKKHQEGGIIVDSQGQYSHPGKNTLIPNADGRITMKDVKTPVLGIDDLGNSTVMQPEEEYQFQGNNVLEIPITGDIDSLVDPTRIKAFKKLFSR